MVSDRTLLKVIGSPRMVRLWGDVVRVGVTAVVLALLVGLLAYHAANVRLMASALHYNDFGKFYYSTRYFLAGRDMYAESPATAVPVSATESRQFLNMNPPHFQVLLVPLAHLELPVAFALWALASLGALTASLVMISRDLRFRWTLSRVLWATLGCLAATPTAATVVTGQLSFLLMLPVTQCWIWARHGHWTRAALGIGALASIKPFLGIFVMYFLVRRQWRLAAAAIAAAGCTVLAGTVVTGVEAYRSWVAALGSVEWTWALMNGSLHGILARAFAPSPFFVPIALWPAATGPMITVLVFGLGLGTVVWLVRTHAQSSVDSIFAGLLLTAQVVSPIGWIYYLWICVGPLMSIYGSANVRRRLWMFSAVAAIAMLCPLPLALSLSTTGVRSLIWGSVYGWGTIALWILALNAGWGHESDRVR
jgi:alpha-1,2-mannosyltransferase